MNITKKGKNAAKQSSDLSKYVKPKLPQKSAKRRMSKTGGRNTQNPYLDAHKLLPGILKKELKSKEVKVQLLKLLCDSAIEGASNIYTNGRSSTKDAMISASVNLKNDKEALEAGQSQDNLNEESVYNLNFSTNQHTKFSLTRTCGNWYVNDKVTRDSRTRSRDDFRRKRSNWNSSEDSIQNILLNGSHPLLNISNIDIKDRAE